MAIEIEWLEEGRICFIRTINTVDLSDIQGLDATLHAHFAQVEHKIHMIADLRELRKAPSFVEIAKVRYPFHPGLGRSITIGLTANPIGRFVITTMSQVVGLSLKDCKTLEEARAYLYEVEGI